MDDLSIMGTYQYASPICSIPPERSWLKPSNPFPLGASSSDDSQPNPDRVRNIIMNPSGSEHVVFDMSSSQYAKHARSDSNNDQGNYNCCGIRVCVCVCMCGM